MKLYVAGPMSGLPEYNLPAFAAAAIALHSHGYEVTNPGRHGVIAEYSHSDYLRRGLHEMLDCEGVAVLTDWQASKGATLEVHVARELGMPVASVQRWLDIPAAHADLAIFPPDAAGASVAEYRRRRVRLALIHTHPLGTLPEPERSWAATEPGVRVI